MIPDIAFMIVVYGCASLAVRALTQHRGTGAFAQAAPWLVWFIAAAAALALLYLGYDVYHLSTTTTGTGGLT